MDASHPSRSDRGTVEAMIRRLFRLLVPSGLLLAAVLLVRRTVRLRDEGARVVPSPDRWPPIPTGDEAALAPSTIRPASDPAPPPIDAHEEATTDPATTVPPTTVTATWLPPVDGSCPPTHLIKVKEASGIYHLPGMLNYERTKPDRCYAEESAAVADGFTKSKR
jgi:hypothetical protein